MTKTTAIAILLLCFYRASSQNNFFVLKKKDKTIATYTNGSYLAFMKKNGQWIAGNIISTSNDSFLLQPRAILYRNTIDTITYPAEAFGFSDVFAIPKPGLHIDYINGSMQPSQTGGHIHWYWIKSGWIFRAGAIGYSALHIMNTVINKQYPFSARNLGIAAGVYGTGFLLKKNYRHYIRLRGKWKLTKVY